MAWNLKLLFLLFTVPIAPEDSRLVKRDSKDPYHHKIHTPKYKRGKVGPVYTFVKTDYNGNFKWGVRHRTGYQYAGYHWVR